MITTKNANKRNPVSLKKNSKFAQITVETSCFDFPKITEHSNAVYDQDSSSIKNKNDTKNTQNDCDVDVEEEISGIIYYYIHYNGSKKTVNTFIRYPDIQGNAQPFKPARIDDKLTFFAKLSTNNESSPSELVKHWKTIGDAVEDKARFRARGFKVFFETSSDIVRPLPLIWCYLFARESNWIDAKPHSSLENFGMLSGTYALTLILTLAFFIGSILEYYYLYKLQKKIKGSQDYLHDDKDSLPLILQNKLRKLEINYELSSMRFINYRHGMQLLFLLLTGIVTALRFISIILNSLGLTPLGMLINLIADAIYGTTFLISTARQFYLLYNVILKTLTEAIYHFENRNYSKGIGVLIKNLFWNQRIWKTAMNLALGIFYIISTSFFCLDLHIPLAVIEHLGLGFFCTYLWRTFYNGFKYFWDRLQLGDWFNSLFCSPECKKNLIDEIIFTKRQIDKASKKEGEKDNGQRKENVNEPEKNLEKLKNNLEKEQAQLEKDIFGDKSVKKSNSTRNILAKLSSQIQTASQQNGGETLYSRKWSRIEERLQKMYGRKTQLLIGPKTKKPQENNKIKPLEINEDDNNWTLSFWNRKFNKLENKANELKIKIPSSNLTKLQKYVENHFVLQDKNLFSCGKK